MGWHFVYLVRCRDGRYYSGYTGNLHRRVVQHRDQGRSAFIAEHGFDRLAYFELCPTRNAARLRKREIHDQLRTTLVGLGISRVGQKTAKAIGDEYKAYLVESMPSWLMDLFEASEDAKELADLCDLAIFTGAVEFHPLVPTAWFQDAYPGVLEGNDDKPKGPTWRPY